MFLEKSTGVGRSCPMPSRLSRHSGATGFDTIALREEASRGLLASLNRGTVKSN
jgi:polysaccharide pyruvyl transferase WcaK-like protein